MKHWPEIVHDVIHAVFIPFAAWMWNERRVLKEVLEDQLERRHHHMLLNPVTLVEKVQQLEKAVTLINSLLPQIPKAIADAQAVVAAKNDPAAEVIALTNLLNDLQLACTEVSAIVKPAPALEPTV